MAVRFGPNLQFKIDVGGTTVATNDSDFDITLVRPENSVSDLLLQVSNFESKNYEVVYDTFSAIELSLRYGNTGDWTKEFSGIIENASPKMALQGFILEVAAVGKCHALPDTHCNTSYGVESLKPTIITPHDIFDDLVDNYINKSFGGANTGYAITKTKIANIVSPNITAIVSPYDSNFNIINKICEIYTAYRAGLASLHWFVDPDGNLFINTIGAHENDASGWPTFWRGSEAASTIEVKKEQIIYNFQKRINEFANKVILISLLRKPTTDTWTETQATDTYWYESPGGLGMDVEADSTIKIVGSYSMKATGDPDNNDYFASYPKARNAAWDLTKIGSLKNPPTINFYIMIEDVSIFGVGDCCDFHLETNGDTSHFWTNLLDKVTTSDQWVHLSYPVGPYYKSALKSDALFTWNETGAGADAPSWSNINSLSFHMRAGDPFLRLWVDDLHFSGMIIREAYNSTSITAKNEFQKIIRNDVALDDSMKASDGSGTTARLAYATLLRLQKQPIVGIIEIPLVIDILPGQLIHVHSEVKADGTFRIDQNFRITEVRHNINAKPTTRLNLTSDLTNSFAIGPPTQASVMAEYVGSLGQKEAKNLKGSGVDIEVPRLSIDYPS